jgi:chromate transporter
VRAVAPLGVTAFGGPQAHIGLIQRELIQRRGWTDDRTFAELLGLCSMLPGPTSTQMIIGLGAIRGGPAGAAAALLAWMAPAALLATLGGIGLIRLFGSGTPLWLEGVQPAAVALVALAAWTLGRRLVTDRFTGTMLLMGAVTTLLWQAPAAFPLVLLAAGLLGARFARRGAEWDKGGTSSTEARRHGDDTEREDGRKDQRAGTAGSGTNEAATRAIVPGWVAACALALFIALLLLLPILRAATGWRPLAWIDAFYRAGSLVFGGGQVLLSVLLGEMTGPGWLPRSQFLDGLGLVQAMPGPLFSISGFVGGALGGVGGALVCLAAMFLPGFLLMIGLLPFWQALRHRPAIRAALVGINACAVGLIVTATLLLYDNAVHNRVDAALLVAAAGAAACYRVPAPLVIAGAALAGWPLHALLG